MWYYTTNFAEAKTLVVANGLLANRLSMSGSSSIHLLICFVFDVYMRQMFPIYFRLRYLINLFKFLWKDCVLNEENVNKRLVMEVVNITKAIWRRCVDRFLNVRYSNLWQVRNYKASDNFLTYSFILVCLCKSRFVKAKLVETDLVWKLVNTMFRLDRSYCEMIAQYIF